MNIVQAWRVIGAKHNDAIEPITVWLFEAQKAADSIVEIRKRGDYQRFSSYEIEEGWLLESDGRYFELSRVDTEIG